MPTNTIFISAGHSDTDPGAVNARLRLKEADLARSLRNRIAAVLRKDGIGVATDGTENVNMERNQAILLASRINGIKLDLHFNAAGNTKATGVEAFADSTDKQLAQALCQSVASVLTIPLRGDKGWKSDRESQHGATGLAWIRRLHRSVLLEICFLSNDAEITAYLAKEHLVAERIAQTLRAYSHTLE